MKRKIISAALCTVLVLSLSMAVYATVSRDSDSSSYNCQAYLNVHDDSYSAYAETTANSGTNTNDYISVSLYFDEYNESYSASYSKTNPGPNYTTAWLNESGYNPDSVSGSHYVQRGAYGWSGSTSVSYTD
jgi:hypothetical protein